VCGTEKSVLAGWCLMLVPLEGIDDAKPDGGFNGSVISFFFSPFICFFDLSFPFQLASNPDGDAKLAACDRFFFRIY